MTSFELQGLGYKVYTAAIPNFTLFLLQYMSDKSRAHIIF